MSICRKGRYQKRYCQALPSGLRNKDGTELAMTSMVLFAVPLERDAKESRVAVHPESHSGPWARRRSAIPQVQIIRSEDRGSRIHPVRSNESLEAEVPAARVHPALIRCWLRAPMTHNSIRVWKTGTQVRSCMLQRRPESLES